MVKYVQKLISGGGSSVVPLRQTTREKTPPAYSRNIKIPEKTIEPVDRTLTCRREMKYLVSKAKAMAIMHFVEAYLPLDRFCKLQPNGMTPIVSLYLDSHNLQLCRESLEGQKNRFKLRVRSYSDDLDSPYFFEIKRRINRVILKARAQVKHSDVASLISGIPLPQDRSTDHASLKQFQLYVNSINAAPVVRVRYLRRAYEGDSNNRVRITFDHQLAFNVGTASKVSLNGLGWQSFGLNGVVLEIKFNGDYPAWLNHVARRFDLRQRSFSKYAISMQNACLSKFCAPKIITRIN
jgi:SPX domain protein involved in polyphosphate accumulation